MWTGLFMEKGQCEMRIKFGEFGPGFSAALCDDAILYSGTRMSRIDRNVLVREMSLLCFREIPIRIARGRLILLIGLRGIEAYEISLITDQHV